MSPFFNTLSKFADRIERAEPYIRNGTITKWCKDLVRDLREEAEKWKVLHECPWKDFAGNPIYDGSRIMHPTDGAIGIVVFCKEFGDTDQDKWRVIYQLGNGRLEISRLCLQIDHRGQAVVIND